MANFGNFEAGQFNADFALSTPEPTNSLGETGTVSIPQTGDLILTKAADPDPVRVGANLAYSIGVLNNSLSAATGVTVIDTLPVDVNFVSATPGCSGASTVTCVLGTMSSGGRATVTIVVTPTVLGSIINNATVTGDQLDLNTGDNTATINTTVNPPPLAEVEPNGPIGSAQVVPIPASGTVEITGILGTIGSGDVDDLDFYSFQGSAGDVVTIDIDNAIGGLQSFDSMVALFGPGPGFLSLAQNDDTSLDPGSISNADSRIDDFPLPSSGLFTVGVTNCCRNFQDGGGVANIGDIRNGDYSLIISGVNPTAVTGGAPQLVSIAVTPEAASVAVGLTQQFSATGDFNDGSTGDLTASVAWASSNPLVVTIDTGGAGHRPGHRHRRHQRYHRWYRQHHSNAYGYTCGTRVYRRDAGSGLDTRGDHPSVHRHRQLQRRQHRRRHRCGHLGEHHHPGIPDLGRGRRRARPGRGPRHRRRSTPRLLRLLAPSGGGRRFGPR